MDSNRNPLHLVRTISRNQFERLVEHLIDRCKKPVLAALNDAKLRPNQIDEIVMVGGMTRMPRVQQLVKDIFGKEGHRGVNPDEVGGDWCCNSGSPVAPGCGSRYPVARCNPTHTWDQDTRWRADANDYQEHDNPHPQERGVYDGGPITSPLSKLRCSRANGRWPTITRRSAVSTWMGSRPHPRVFRKSKWSSRSMPTGVLSVTGQGHGHAEAANHPDRRIVWNDQGRGREDEAGCRASRGTKIRRKRNSPMSR